MIETRARPFTRLTFYEECALDAFIASDDAQRLLGDSGEWALIFDYHSGIGRTVHVKVRSASREYLERNITDYESW